MSGPGAEGDEAVESELGLLGVARLEREEEVRARVLAEAEAEARARERERAFRAGPGAAGRLRRREREELAELEGLRKEIRGLERVLGAGGGGGGASSSRASDEARREGEATGAGDASGDGGGSWARGRLERARERVSVLVEARALRASVGRTGGGRGGGVEVQETERERLVRTGVLTPFASVEEVERAVRASGGRGGGGGGGGGSASASASASASGTRAKSGWARSIGAARARDAVTGVRSAAKVMSMEEAQALGPVSGGGFKPAALRARAEAGRGGRPASRGTAPEGTRQRGTNRKWLKEGGLCATDGSHIMSGSKGDGDAGARYERELAANHAALEGKANPEVVELLDDSDEEGGLEGEKEKEQEKVAGVKKSRRTRKRGRGEEEVGISGREAAALAAPPPERRAARVALGQLKEPRVSVYERSDADSERYDSDRSDSDRSDSDQFDSDRSDSDSRSVVSSGSEYRLGRDGDEDEEEEDEEDVEEEYVDVGGAEDVEEGEEGEETPAPGPSSFFNESAKDVEFEGGLRVPGRIWDRLFEYQRTGVKWMWELHCQGVGGIIGDEMGLGKTIQVAAFLAGLQHSGRMHTSLVVCPATLIRQWQRELVTWHPAFKVALLHETGRDDAAADPFPDGDLGYPTAARGSFYGWGGSEGTRAHMEMVLSAAERGEPHVVITSYEQLRRHARRLLKVKWQYAVLDEGHKVRNPDAGVTLVAKRLATHHRILLTGTPIQNRLDELWSLFDFVFPGKLGTLPVFQREFAMPVAAGAYKNASEQQVVTARRCSLALRDIVGPYLLRRVKADVNAYLPKKSEQVLFCELTEGQRRMYRAFLDSDECAAILARRRKALYGIDLMRKVCNHPDLLERSSAERPSDYGHWERSGKLKVVRKVLELWCRGKGRHKCLVFCQTRQMLDILEVLVGESGLGLPYARMDGTTPVADRLKLIDVFNQGAAVDAERAEREGEGSDYWKEDDRAYPAVFLLTTRVGGLGVNLTGASRVLIFDPDWNPSTDMQARERSWRIGQRREVTVYRLLTKGTIEEKVYHRQIYKQAVTNSVLRDPSKGGMGHRLFKAKDLYDLFTLDGVEGEGAKRVRRAKDGKAHGGGTDGDVLLEKFGTAAAATATATAGDRGMEGLDVRPDETGTALENGEGGAEDEAKAGGETGVLKSLLMGGSVGGAFDHDAVVGEDAGSVARHVAEQRLQEAKRIAESAARALRESQRSVRARFDPSLPTWTGRNGLAGAAALQPRRRFGAVTNPLVAHKPTSVVAHNSAMVAHNIPKADAAVVGSGSLLAAIRRRNEEAETGAVGGADNLEAEMGALARKLRAFLRERHAGGGASSDTLVREFPDVGSVGMVGFKQLLKQVAAKDRRSGMWVLKAAFLQGEDDESAGGSEEGM